MNEPDLRLMFVGDLILDEPEPDFFFDLARNELGEADVLVGHVEVPHTNRGFPCTGDVPAPPSDPRHLYALGRAGFHVVTLAGNHIFDAGPDGIQDTIAALAAQGITTTGAGPNLREARQPAIIERRGVGLGFLSYNCVGPRESWASDAKAGCAYVQVISHYEVDYASPGGPPKVYTFAEQGTLGAMQAEIERLRRHVDILAVALHKGVGHTPVHVAAYERAVAQAAIDAGADIVVGHHAHILRGIEVYKGRPIYHGLGNFVTVTHALSLEGNPSPERLAWARRRRELFGFEPDPLYPIYPFHPEARNTMIAACDVVKSGVRTAGFLPCMVRPTGQPEVLGHDERGEALAAYVGKITREAGLEPLQLYWRDNQVLFLPGP